MSSKIGEVDERIREVSRKGYVPKHCSRLMKLKVVKGLYRYAEKIDRILEICDIIGHMGQAWDGIWAVKDFVTGYEGVLWYHKAE